MVKNRFFLHIPAAFIAILLGCQNPSKGNVNSSDDSQYKINESNEEIESRFRQKCFFNSIENDCHLTGCVFRHLQKISEQGFLSSGVLGLSEIKEIYLLSEEAVHCIRQKYCQGEININKSYLSKGRRSEDSK